MNISIVIPNFNGRDLLLNNIPKILDAVKNYNGGSIELIITDDSSKDGSIEAVESLLKRIISKNNTRIPYKVLKNFTGTNRGFSGNVNIGVKNSTGDIIILLNSDVVPKVGFLEPLLSHFTNDSVFAVGCMDESIEDGKTVLRGRGIGKWERGFLVHNAGKLDSERTLWVSGGSGAFRKSIWDKLGGLNEIYNPFYWEDIDLSYRAQKAGYKVLFEKKSVVRHEHSKGAIKTFYKPFRVRKIVYRNQFLFTWLNLTDKMLLVKHFLWFPYHIANAIKNRDLAFFYGLVMAIFKIPKVLVYRSKTKSFWVKTDEEVTSNLIN
ncbi:MAG TPA: glycosyltransferase [Patescibacteria group bacterium]